MGNCNVWLLFESVFCVLGLLCIYGWVRKQDLPSPIPDERTPSPPPQRGDSTSLLSEVLIELYGFRAFVGERFNTMDTRLDVMDTRFDGMDTRITRLKDDMSFIRRYFDPSTDS